MNIAVASVEEGVLKEKLSSEIHFNTEYVVVGAGHTGFQASLELASQGREFLLINDNPATLGSGIPWDVNNPYARTNNTLGANLSEAEIKEFIEWFKKFDIKSYFSSLNDTVEEWDATIDSITTGQGNNYKQNNLNALTDLEWSYLKEIVSNEDSQDRINSELIPRALIGLWERDKSIKTITNQGGCIDCISASLKKIIPLDEGGFRLELLRGNEKEIIVDAKGIVLATGNSPKDPLIEHENYIRPYADEDVLSTISRLKEIKGTRDGVAVVGLGALGLELIRICASTIDSDSKIDIYTTSIPPSLDAEKLGIENLPDYEPAELTKLLKSDKHMNAFELSMAINQDIISAQDSFSALSYGPKIILNAKKVILKMYAKDPEEAKKAYSLFRGEFLPIMEDIIYKAIYPNSKEFTPININSHLGSRGITAEGLNDAFHNDLKELKNKGISPIDSLRQMVGAVESCLGQMSEKQATLFVKKYGSNCWRGLSIWNKKEVVEMVCLMSDKRLNIHKTRVRGVTSDDSDGVCVVDSDGEKNTFPLVLDCRGYTNTPVDLAENISDGKIRSLPEGIIDWANHSIVSMFVDGSKKWYAWHPLPYRKIGYGIRAEVRELMNRLGI